MTNTKPTALFANKSDLLASQARVKELEKEITALKASPLGSQLATAQNEIARLKNENQALRTRPLAVTPTKTATTPAKVSPAPAKASTSTGAADTYEWQPAPKPVLSREKFSTLSAADKAAFVKAGGKLID